MMVGSAPVDANLATDISKRARVLLEGSPDTDAVVLVYDDDALTSVVVEPFDLNGAVTVPGGAPGLQTVSEGPDALSSVLGNYLRLLRVNWHPTPTAISAGSGDLDRLSQEAADAALNERRQKEYRVPEKQQAQAKLSSADARWIAALVLDVARQGFASDLEAHIRERGERQ